MKKKLCIIVLSIILVTFGCAKEENAIADIDDNSLDLSENIDEYIEYASSESILGSNEMTELTLTDMNYDIIDSVMGKEIGSFIAEDEKFWITAYHINESTDQVDDMAYILTDSHERIYSELPRTIVPDGFSITPISEDALAIYSSYDEEAGYIINNAGNDITSEYVNDGERILQVYNDDNGVHIFTILVEDNYSEQNIIFKVYDDRKNCELSFTKKEIEDKYGIEWSCRAENLGISFLGGNTYCVNMKLSSTIHGSIDVLGEEILYIDTTRKKVFLMTMPQGYSGISDGKYIMRNNTVAGNCIVDIENETYEPLDWIRYRDGYTYRYSELWNGRFIAKPSDRDLFAIYDIHGNLICDLESDTVNVTACTDFYDGYALIEITNEGGTSFVTIIDENGEWQFEPVPGTIRDEGISDRTQPYIKATEQFIALKNDESAVILLDKSGNLEELPTRGYPNYVIETDGELQYFCHVVLKTGESGYLRKTVSK